MVCKAVAAALLRKKGWNMSKRMAELLLSLGLVVLNLEIFLVPFLGTLTHVSFKTRTHMITWAYTSYPTNVALWLSTAMVIVGAVFCVKYRKRVD